MNSGSWPVEELSASDEGEDRSLSYLVTLWGEISFSSIPKSSLISRLLRVTVFEANRRIFFIFFLGFHFSLHYTILCSLNNMEIDPR